MSQRVFYKIIFFTFISLQYGCQTTNPNCQEPDWYERGRVAGLKGLSGNKLDQNLYYCSKKNAVPSAKLYKKGYQDGLSLYCLTDNFYNLGLSQTSIKLNLCPKEDRDQLYQSYLTGKKESDLQ